MKTRTFTRILSLITVFVLVFALSVTAFAAGGEEEEDEEGDYGIMLTSLEIDTPVANSYKAYRLLNLKTGLIPHSKPEFDHEDGDTAQHTDECYSYNYTVNETYRTALQEVIGTLSPDLKTDGSVSDAEILEYLNSMDDNSTEVRTFADAMYQKIKTMKADQETATGDFGSIPQGYYLIAETSALTTDDARSLVMLDTHGQLEITIEPKEDVPTVDKKVKDGEAWTTHADIKVGEDAEFQLTGTLPYNYKNFETYKYIFHDTLSEGLTLKPDTIKVTVDGTEVDKSLYTINIKDDGSNPTNDDCSFEIVFDDLTDTKYDSLNITGGKEDGSKIVVTYSATVTKATVTYGNPGNPNDVHLEYSNDPYENTTGKTTEKHVVVFSFKLVVNKYDDGGRKLDGADFTLKKWNEGTSAWDEYLDPNENTGSVFTFEGLTEGKYQLSETVTPDGYVGIEPIEFEVKATYADDNSDGEDEIKTLTVTIDGKDAVSDGTFELDGQLGVMTTDVENVSGTRLPSTGGIGVYVVYALGGLVVMIGLAFVVKSKRHSAE